MQNVLMYCAAQAMSKDSSCRNGLIENNFLLDKQSDNAYNRTHKTN